MTPTGKPAHRMFRFSHRSDDGKTYYWESVGRLPGDSRSEVIHCPVGWFWSHRP